MKKCNLFLNTMLIIGLFIFTGCSDSDDNNPEVPMNESITRVQYQRSRDAIATLTAITEDVYLANSGVTQKSSSQNNNDCVAISSERIGDTVFITLDYGRGCQLRNGIMVSGVINIRFDANDTKDEISMATTLDNYFYEDISIVGGAITTFTSDDITENLKFKTSTDYSLKWEDGLTAIESSTYTNETIFEATLSSIELYNLMSGFGTTTFSSGDVFTDTINESLRSDLDCEYVVSGVVEVNRNGKFFTKTDFGSGECDNEALLTDADGNETIIKLEEIIQ